ncbi:GH14132 [Drosophila grimshawi]|uniref:procollagen-proline 4-dioxygenase n=1 Tax=Drosophila grimshawi TaxID=7222 RepID=B4JV93_DROGR|nr:GH14132 [Drosophila grimshawi]
MIFLRAECKLSAALAVLPVLIWCGANAEYFSSIHEMSNVFIYEQKMLQHIQKFIADNERKLDFLRARLDEYESERSEAQQWGIAYFESPLNKYLLSKRLTVDWQRIENLMAAATGEKPLKRLQRLRQRDNMPKPEDLTGTIDGLLRIQFIYRLQTKHLAAGILDGVAYGMQLNAKQCLEIGQQALTTKYPELAHAWLLEAHNRLSSSDRSKLLPHILGQLVQVKATLSDSRGVNSTLEILKELEPSSGHHHNYEVFLQAQTQIDDLTLANPFKEHEPVPEDLSNLSHDEIYRYTCNGYIKKTPPEERNLRCGYMSETHPFLLLAPLKVEELNRNPLLVLYHDVIYQSEIDVLNKLNRKRYERAGVVINSTSTVSKKRTSQHIFIAATRHKVLRTIDQRVADMTNLNMQYAEDHQLADYGIGGHYSQHFDWFGNSDLANSKCDEMGNRIATVLFYLSDVAQGGGTAFPILKQLLKPKKYAAAFWYNLHASGKGDWRNLHGGCPIIVGSKWVLNRWIREYDQSDLRPCDLWDDSVFNTS